MLMSADIDNNLGEPNHNCGDPSHVICNPDYNLETRAAFVAIVVVILIINACEPRKQQAHTLQTGHPQPQFRNARLY